jgi:hypothetical protein
MTAPADTYTVFADFARHVHTGPDRDEAVEQARLARAAGDAQSVVIFDDRTGNYTEVDPAGRVADARVLPPKAAPPRKGPGRPRLGVFSREISLLPRHWEWLNAQRGGASAALRRLVGQARREHPQRDRAQLARDAACKFLGMVGGDLPGYEELTRALYDDRFDDARTLAEAWPRDMRDHVGRLLSTAEHFAALARREEADLSAASGPPP